MGDSLRSVFRSLLRRGGRRSVGFRSRRGPGFGQRLLLFHGLVDGQGQSHRIARLGKESEHPAFVDRPDGPFGGGTTRQHHAHHLRKVLGYPGQKLNTGNTRHLVVGNQHIDQPAFQDLHCLFGRMGGVEQKRLVPHARTNPRSKFGSSSTRSTVAGMRNSLFLVTF